MTIGFSLSCCDVVFHCLVVAFFSMCNSNRKTYLIDNKSNHDSISKQPCIKKTQKIVPQGIHDIYKKPNTKQNSRRPLQHRDQDTDLVSNRSTKSTIEERP